MALKKIVAVDDSGIILKMLEKVLSPKYEFRAFSEGTRALKFLEKKTVDLIILDIDMPEMDGFELLNIIRLENHLKNVPVIFLTSNGDKNHVIKAITSGANDYAVKPIDEDVLLEKINVLLSD